jgi:hypothetical protein
LYAQRQSGDAVLLRSPDRMPGFVVQPSLSEAILLQMVEDFCAGQSSGRVEQHLESLQVSGPQERALVAEILNKLLASTTSALVDRDNQSSDWSDV